MVKKCCMSLSSIGTFLSGIGQLLVGVVAIYAIYHSDVIIEKITELKKILEGLKSQSEELRNQNKQISNQIVNLTSIIKNMTASQIVAETLRYPKEITENNLRDLLPLNDSIEKGQVYLPKDSIAKTLEFLNSPNKSPIQMQEFLMQQLKTK